jgi:hypothetical protein
MLVSEALEHREAAFEPGDRLGGLPDLSERFAQPVLRSGGAGVVPQFGEDVQAAPEQCDGWAASACAQDLGHAAHGVGLAAPVVGTPEAVEGAAELAGCLCLVVLGVEGVGQAELCPGAPHRVAELLEDGGCLPQACDRLVVVALEAVDLAELEQDDAVGVPVAQQAEQVPAPVGAGDRLVRSSLEPVDHRRELEGLGLDALLAQALGQGQAAGVAGEGLVEASLFAAELSEDEQQ